jgi:hypothetical protein
LTVQYVYVAKARWVTLVWGPVESSRVQYVYVYVAKVRWVIIVWGPGKTLSAFHPPYLIPIINIL